MVFEALNRLRWKDGKNMGLPGVEIIILHRGAPNDRKTIRGEDVKEIRRSCFVYGSMDTTIPLHRIREVRKDGRAVWKRPPKKEA